jgi:hypothetical protein
MDTKHEGIISDWISSTDDAITALQEWLDSLREWQRNRGRELADCEFVTAYRRMAGLMADEWADRNPCDIDKLAAVVRGEELEEPDSWAVWSNSDWQR